MKIDTSAALLAAVLGDKTMTQGATLITRHTKNWPAEEISASNALERCQIFTDFNIADEGRGRKLVARFATQEGAAQFMALRDLVPALSSQLTAETARANAAEYERDQAVMANKSDGKIVVDMAGRWTK